MFRFFRFFTDCLLMLLDHATNTQKRGHVELLYVISLSRNSQKDTLVLNERVLMHAGVQGHLVFSQLGSQFYPCLVGGRSTC